MHDRNDSSAFIEDSDTYTFEDTARTFFELASAQRIAILYKIAEVKCNLTRLSKDLDCTMPEIRRNIIRLTNSGMVDRESNGTFFLTTFGKTILEQIPALDFLSRNKDYFSDHTFSPLPLKFIKRVGSLSNSNLISGLVSIDERLGHLQQVTRICLCHDSGSANRSNRVYCCQIEEGRKQKF
jgi:predicted transcriptional regulator